MAIGMICIGVWLIFYYWVNGNLWMNKFLFSLTLWLTYLRTCRWLIRKIYSLIILCIVQVFTSRRMVSYNWQIVDFISLNSWYIKIICPLVFWWSQWNTNTLFLWAWSLSLWSVTVNKWILLLHFFIKISPLRTNLVVCLKNKLIKSKIV